MVWKTTLEIWESLQIISSNYFSKNKSIESYLRIVFVLLFGVFFNSALLAQTAPVIVPSGGFGIDGNLKANLTVSGIGDWIPGPVGTGGYVLSSVGVPLNSSTTTLIRDEYNNGNDNSFTQGAKTGQNPEDWTWTKAPVTGKGDIHNAMYHLGKDAQNNEWIIVGSDRRETTGTSYIDFGFFQNTLTADADGGFTSAGTQGGRTVNDILLTIEYPSGGSVAKVFFYVWTEFTDRKGAKFYAYELKDISGTNIAFAQSNATTVDVPFGAFGSTNYGINQFVEAALNLTEILGRVDPCIGVSIKTILIKTKNSDSETAALNDFIDPIQVKLSFGTATISYEGSPVCKSTPSITPTLTGVTGGNFTSSSSNLVVDSSTGTVDVAASQPGTYDITYTFVTKGCTKTTKTSITIVANPAAPVAGPVTQPTCTSTTGSFQITNFDASSTYNFTPGVVSISITGLVTANSGTYTFKQTNAAGCTSPASGSVVVTDQPNTPAAPVVDSTVNTTCSLNNGSISLVATEGVEYSIDGENYQSNGNFNNLLPNTYSVTARIINGECISSSTEVIINAIPDTEDPTFGSVADINVNTDINICGAVVTFSAPTATDNCEGTVVTLNEGSLASGSEFPVGTTTVTYTATDAAGNTTSVSFNVIVTDNQDPTITCPANVNQSTDAGESFAIVTFEDATATDNCEVTVEQTSGLTSGSEFPIGVSTVEFTATDASGNTTTCSFTITVIENTPPAPPAPPTVTVTQPTCENPTGTITVQTIEGLTYNINGVDYQASGVFTDLAPGTYSVIAQDGLGQDSEITEVILNEALAVVIETTSISLCVEDSTFDLFNLLSGEFDKTGVWQGDTAAATAALDGSFIDPSLLEVGDYTYSYILSGVCPSNTVVDVNINDDCVVLACSLEDIRDSISKAVTPNGDGFNDFFQVNLDLECGFTYNVQIFNRWGAEVYSMRNYQNNWDGFSNKSFSNSNQLPSGTYYYILEINGGAFEPIQGYIFLGTK